MVIDVSVTPLAVAPLASPGPHGEVRVPNLATAGALVGADVLAPVAGAAPLPWLPPHAAATIPMRRAPVARRTRELLDRFRGSMESPRSKRFRGNLSTSL